MPSEKSKSLRHSRFTSFLNKPISVRTGCKKQWQHLLPPKTFVILLLSIQVSLAAATMLHNAFFIGFSSLIDADKQAAKKAESKKFKPSKYCLAD